MAHQSYSLSHSAMICTKGFLTDVRDPRYSLIPLSIFNTIHCVCSIALLVGMIARNSSHKINLVYMSTLYFPCLRLAVQFTTDVHVDLRFVSEC